jgi:lysophospholipase L1-like esterase
MADNKKILNIVVLATGLAALSGTAAYILSNRFRKAVNSVISKKKVGCGSTFLFIGDSNTKASFSYADQLKKFCPDSNIKKIAENGKTTKWMFDELMKEYKSGRKYDVISILGGSNDISGGRPLDEIERNLNSIYYLAKRFSNVVVAVAPPNKAFYPNYTDEQRKKLDDLTKWISKNPEPDYFIDFYNITNRKDFFLADNLHPNTNAHNVLASQFTSKIIV